MAHADAEEIAVLAAGLGGQALERARLYERERESRAGLDRILRVAPSFLADNVESATAAICTEAAATFGADTAILWRRRGQRLELACTAPPEILAPGLEASLDDFPTLRDAVENGRVSFVADVQDEARGEGLVRVRALGLRSSFRVPIAIGTGEAELILTVSWTKEISEPDPSTVVLLRRFADQAGFALEQIERRRAQGEAAKRADETRRLQEVTAALSLASTSTEVTDACLTHVLEAVDAEAGFVVLSQPEGVTVDFVSSSGTPTTSFGTGERSLSTRTCLLAGDSAGGPVWALTRAEMAGFDSAIFKIRDGCRFRFAQRPACGCPPRHLPRPRELSDDQRRWLRVGWSRSAREPWNEVDSSTRASFTSPLRRLQHMTAALSNALTRTDVAKVVWTRPGGARRVGSSARSRSRRTPPRAAPGLGRVLRREHRLSTGGFARRADAGNRALKRRVSSSTGRSRTCDSPFPGSEDIELAEHESFLYVPWSQAAGRTASLPCPRAR